MQDCVSTLLGLNLPVLKMVSYFPLYLPVLDMRKIWRTLDIRDERCHHLEWGHYQNHLFTCSPPRSLPCQTVHLPWHIFSLRRKAFPLSRSSPLHPSGGTPSLRKSAQLSSLLVPDPSLSQTPRRFSTGFSMLPTSVSPF